jgi:hypothetical protein
MKIILNLNHRDIKNLKPWVNEIRFNKGLEGFVKEYERAYVAWQAMEKHFNK